MPATAQPESRLIEFPLLAVAGAPVPMASCIMPTADRRALVPQAIRHFLRQDYPNRELIIVDDGADSIADLIPRDERIRYLRLDRRLSMGVKHNLACEMARGEIIIHWDDDDWISPHRISYQVAELERQPAETICGLSRIFFYDPQAQRAWEYQYPGGRPWVIGSTFCYYKRFSERNHFPDMNEGADTTFVWNLHDVNVHAHPDNTFYVGTVHSRNTSPKRTESAGWRPLANEHVRRLMDEDDWSFYQKFGSAS
jgi:glycosyltransferase involved in cell wall biosynthesis